MFSVAIRLHPCHRNRATSGMLNLNFFSRTATKASSRPCCFRPPASAIIRGERRCFSSLKKTPWARWENTTDNKQNMRQGGNIQYSWGGALITLTIGGAAILYFSYLRDQIVSKSSKAAIAKTEVIGTPKLGGPWTLVDAKTGKMVTSNDLRGHYQLIYFGFSFCPDICPDESQKQQEIIEKLDAIYAKGGTKADSIDKMLQEPGPVQPIYITVDPSRDTCAQLQDYCVEFHPRLLGLTGCPEQIKKVTRLFRVYYNEGIRTDDSEDYLVDHSIIHYFMDRNGEFCDFFGKNLTADEVVERICKKIDADAQKKKK